VTEDPAVLATAAADTLRERTGVDRHDVALVLGSGWVPAAEMLGETVAELPVTDLPGFPPPAVAGHAGTLRSVRVGDPGADARRALVFLGRTHLYEGRGVACVVHGVRTAVAAGCGVVVLTNGCGGLRPTYVPGQPVLISDHINLTGESPVVGATFIDLTDLYSPRLRTLCRMVDPTLEEGVYVQLRGPHYETPAEVGMVRALGGDLVGMSTTLEAIAAREAGAEVLGLSLVTNLAAGMTGAPLDHEEVLAAGRDAASRMGALLADVLGRL
jgi:purine-nucleoside phosphorylase